MIFRWPSLLIFLLLIWCFVQAGCVSRLPESYPVAAGQQKNILKCYNSFREKNVALPIDSDIKVDLQSFGSHMTADGYLQMQPPRLLRMTIIDKVGRPAFVLLGNGEEITMVNAMKGEALTGTIYSLTRKEDNPVALQTDDVLGLLTGRFAPDPTFLLNIRQDKKTGSLVWLIFSSTGGNQNSILFDPSSECILRHVINKPSGEILMDIEYVREGEKNAGCTLPGRLRLTGSSLGGEIVLQYEKLYPVEAIPDKTFELDLPKHYKIRRME